MTMVFFFFRSPNRILTGDPWIRWPLNTTPSGAGFPVSVMSSRLPRTTSPLTLSFLRTGVGDKIKPRSSMASPRMAL